MGDIYFSIDNILPLVWICVGVALAAMLWLLTFYRSRVSLKGETSKADADAGNELPAVSVVVYANDNAIALARMLPQVLEQDYPASVEVIVVNDGSVEEVTDVVNHLSVTHTNLYQTFVPDEAHNLSRKKLGISLGVKAAHNPYVVLTCAECEIGSAGWLRAMAGPFAKGKDVVLGFAYIAGLKGARNRFDEVLEGVKWLSAALRGNPYRGTGYNIGYSRKVFFDAKGFSRSLTFHYGDDDLFINQISTGDNCAVVLDGGSVLSVESHDPAKLFGELRLRHCFTARFLPKGTSRFFGFSSIMMWLWLAAVVVGIVFSLPNALPGCILLLSVPALWIQLGSVWRKSGARLGIELNPWLLPFVAMGRWTRTLRCKLMCGRASRRNYTWIQK